MARNFDLLLTIARAPFAIPPGVLGLILLSTPLALAARPQTYPSPDGAMRAVIVPLAAPKGVKGAESRVVIFRASGPLVSTADYSSVDGQHGFRVERARWTPDSKFFVYSLSSSGGHQPWKSPTCFFSVTTGRTQDLGRLIGKAVLSPDFKLIAPNTLSIRTWTKPPLDYAHEITEDVRLSGLKFDPDAQPLQPRTLLHPDEQATPAPYSPVPPAR